MSIKNEFLAVDFDMQVIKKKAEHDIAYHSDFLYSKQI